MTTDSASVVIDKLLSYPAWALIRRSTRVGAKDTIGALAGKPWVANSLLDIPLETGVPSSGNTVDRLVAVPFRQIAERGFEVHDDGTPLTVVDLEFEAELAVSEVTKALPSTSVAITDAGGFDISDAEYEQIVTTIINEEVGQGEGANLVIGRTYRAVLADWSADKALAVYRKLLEHENGAYWTFIFFTGERYLIGASPERHVSLAQSNVRMNPISGTFRLPEIKAQDAEGVVAELKPQLLEFLKDPKEIFELYMVVDEELKMMCDICSAGGQVLGPFLKPMSRLIHTEYLLAGNTDHDPREVLRDTMFAATVTGSPVENAVRLIKKYESSGRGYYGAALALFGRDTDGNPTLDSPIVIRTADVSLTGELSVSVGATLVRDSSPASEVAETHAKSAGILSAFGLVPAAPPIAIRGIEDLVTSEEVLLELNQRNRKLSPFWLSDQSGNLHPDPRLAGKTAVILDGGDDFAKMIRHLLNAFGLKTTLTPHKDYQPGCLKGYDLVVLGPGPGDPRDLSDRKIVNLAAAVEELQHDESAKFLAVCLGHQALCHQLGLELHYKDIVFQGTQSPVKLKVRTQPGWGPDTELVGFYNTFVARAGSGVLPAGVSVDADPDTGDINAIYGPRFSGIQFHAESILTQHGYSILHDLITNLLFAA